LEGTFFKHNEVPEKIHHLIFGGALIAVDLRSNLTERFFSISNPDPRFCVQIWG
jgi:hypothetical protein